MAGIRKAGTIQYMPEFLLERAKFHRQQEDFNQAQTDLNYLCSKVKVDADELPQVADTVQRIERALVVLRQSDSVIEQSST